MKACSLACLRDAWRIQDTYINWNDLNDTITSHPFSLSWGRSVRVLIFHAISCLRVFRIYHQTVTHDFHWSTRPNTLKLEGTSKQPRAPLPLSRLSPGANQVIFKHGYGILVNVMWIHLMQVLVPKLRYDAQAMWVVQRSWCERCRDSKSTS